MTLKCASNLRSASYSCNYCGVCSGAYLHYFLWREDNFLLASHAPQKLEMENISLK